jgi:hypothetical protein
MNLLRFGSQLPAQHSPKPVIYLVDGADQSTVPPTPSQHAMIMDKLLMALGKDTIGSVHLEPVPDDFIKSPKALFQALHTIRTRIEAGSPVDYVMIPAGMFIPTAVINNLIQPTIPLKGTTIKQNGAPLLTALTNALQSPEQYPEFHQYLKQNQDNITFKEFTYLPKIIKEINAIDALGTTVYGLSGNRHFTDIRSIKDASLRPKLYHYLSKGGSTLFLTKLLKKLDTTWQQEEVNLLALSNAQFVKTIGVNNKPYLFTPKGDYITQQARGTYNFAPVRDPKTGEVKGYSFTDEQTVHIPKAEFWGAGKAFWGLPQNDHMASFLGRPLHKVLATESQHRTLARILAKPHPNWIDRWQQDRLNHKLFDMRQVLPAATIEERGLDLYARYVDATGTLSFNTNDRGEVYFPKASCEMDRNARPSVFPMHGSCFAMVTAVVNDIQRRMAGDETTPKGLHDRPFGHTA